MSARRKARKRALDILFEAEQRGTEPLALLADRQARTDPPLNVYTGELVRGVIDHQGSIDALLASHLTARWTFARLPAVDRGLLRIAAYEIRYGTGIPAAVAVSEAVALADHLSTDESPSYINGILASILAEPAEPVHAET